MTLPFLRRVAVQLLVVTVALAAVLTSGAPAQSLGDVAKKEEARRKRRARRTAAARSTRTTICVPQPAAAATSPAPPASSASADDAKAAARPDARTPRQTGREDRRQGRRPRATEAPPTPRPPNRRATPHRGRSGGRISQDALDRSKIFADSLQSRINGLTADFSARDDPAQRSVVAADRQKALTELDRVKKDIQQQTKALADLQEEARKSGVPPGWLR